VEPDLVPPAGHEADLEQAFIFLADAPGGPAPVWFACAAHDYSGDDLRRRWDDPLLVRVGDHPVIHAGAGSHAAYFEQGEYLTAAPIPAFHPLRGLLQALRAFWRDTLRQDDPGDLASSIEGALSIPFIDYARADGKLGRFQHRFKTYGREGKPCPRRDCGGTVRRIVQGGRSTFYCPTCQH